MGEFNANRRKQSWNETAPNNKETGAIGKTDRRSSNRSKSILRKQNCEPDAKDVNFWTKVFCNNNNNCSNNNGNSSPGRKSQDNYPASRSPVPPTSTSSNDTSNNRKLNHTTTATLLNNILSNIKENRPTSNEMSTASRSPNSTVNMRELDDITLNNATNLSGNENTQYPQSNDSVRKSTYNLITSIKSKNTEAKRKSTSASGQLLQQHEAEQTRNERSHESNGQRASLNSDINFDLNEANDTFLRTLNELRLDYDDLSTNRSVEHRNSHSSKERYTQSMRLQNYFDRDFSLMFAFFFVHFLKKGFWKGQVHHRCLGYSSLEKLHITNGNENPRRHNISQRKSSICTVK